MNRRNVLIGLGGLVAGGGALIGTGAFTTVEAQRTVSVETAGDADAFLGLAPARDDFEGDNFVVEDEGTIQINLDASSPGEGDGLNQNARTVFRNLVRVSNNGTQPVESVTLEFTETPEDVDPEDTFSFPVDDDSGNQDDVGSGDILTDENNIPGELGPGEDINFGLEIDLLEGGDDGDLPDGGDYILTIEAQAVDN